MNTNEIQRQKQIIYLSGYIAIYRKINSSNCLELLNYVVDDIIRKSAAKFLYEKNVQRLSQNGSTFEVKRKWRGSYIKDYKNKI